MKFQKAITTISVLALGIGIGLASVQADAQGQGVSNDGTAGRVGTRHIIGGAVNPTKLSDGLLTGEYTKCVTNTQPSISAPNGYGDPTGATGDINRALFTCGPTGLYAQYHVKGAGQTLLGPLLSTTLGVDISQDQTDDEGVEYVFGALGTIGGFTKTVGTDSGACLRVKAYITDVSGTDDFNIGWRKNEAFQAAVDNYDEGAWVNVNAGQLVTETVLNNAATVSTTVTGSTWADTAAHTVTVCFSGRRVSYWYDGARVQTSVTYDFDSGEVIVPFVYFLQAADVTPVYFQEVEIYDITEANAQPST